jgi:hypothetical protein
VSLQLDLVVAPMNDPTDADKAVGGTETAKKASRRRRRSYTREIAYSICERLVEGESLRQICQDTSMPARSTIFLWLEKHEEFAKWYTLAKRMQIEDLLDEALEWTRGPMGSSSWPSRSVGGGVIRSDIRPHASGLGVTTSAARLVQIMVTPQGADRARASCAIAAAIC